MIGLGNSIEHLNESIAYGWNLEKDAEVVYRKYLIGETPKEISREFEYIQSLNEKCRKNTFSFVISPTVEDGKKMTLDNLNEIATEFVKEMKLEKHQGIAFVHKDKEHIHLHLYVNRIDFEGKAYKDYYIGKYSQMAAERVALKLNYKTVRQINKQKLENLKDIRKHIHNKHKLVYGYFNLNDTSIYVSQMEKLGITVKPVINKSGKLQGFRYLINEVSLKGSEVHRSMSLNIMKKEFNQLKESTTKTKETWQK